MNKNFGHVVLYLDPVIHRPCALAQARIRLNGIRDETLRLCNRADQFKAASQ